MAAEGRIFIIIPPDSQILILLYPNSATSSTGIRSNFLMPPRQAYSGYRYRTPPWGRSQEHVCIDDTHKTVKFLEAEDKGQSRFRHRLPYSSQSFPE